jgi:hypothetical protein
MKNDLIKSLIYMGKSKDITYLLESNWLIKKQYILFINKYKLIRRDSNILVLIFEIHFIEM